MLPQLLSHRRSHALLVAVLVVFAFLMTAVPVTQAAHLVANSNDSFGSAMRLQGTQPSITTVVGNPFPAVVGQTVTFTATVTSTGGTDVPTGTVTFLVDGNAIGTVTLEGGVASLTTSFSAPGSPSISAAYSGDAIFSESFGFAFFSVMLLPTTTTLVSSSNPGTVGQPVTFTATVTATGGGGVPTGFVYFNTGSFPLTEVALDGSGMASLTTTFTRWGSMGISASYGGDANFASSQSDFFSQFTNQAFTSMTLTSSVNPSTAGESVTFTVTVTANPPGSVTPYGAVSFSVDGAIQPDVFLDGSGVATFTTSELAAGEHNIYAYYAGNQDFSFNALSLTQVVSAGVSTVQQDIQHIIDTVNGMNIHHGTKNALNAKLQTALSAVNRGNTNAASNQLGAFINQVEAQRGKKITVADANTLISLANAVIGRLAG